MRTRTIQTQAGGAMVALALFFVTVATSHATAFNVTIDTSGFAAASATLAFDFTDGGSPDNTVELGTLTSNGTQGSAVLIGGVSGTGPWIFSDSSFGFSELLVPFGPLGSMLSFSITSSDNAPLVFPDLFSMLILDASASFPLVTTDAPGATDALFTIEITGTGPEGLTVYTPNESGVSVDVSPVVQMPEPGTLALLFVSAVALFARKRRLQSLA